MGGFLGIGKSDQAKALEEQARLKRIEADRARREAEIRLAERKAKKGQETAKIKLGTDKKELPEEQLPSAKVPQLSENLALGSGKKTKTGVQL